MKKAVVLLGCLFLVLSLFFVSAQEENSPEDYVSELKSQLQGATLPGPLKLLFGNSQFSLFVELNSGEMLELGVAVEDGVVTTVDSSPFTDAAVTLTSTEATFVSLEAQGYSASAVQDALDSGAITLEANGFWNKLKLSSALGLFNLMG